MERQDLGRRREVAVSVTLLALLLVLVVAGFALVAWVTYVAPLQVAALNRAGVTTIPPAMGAMIQVSNFVTTKWYLLIAPLALIVALLLSRLISR